MASIEELAPIADTSAFVFTGNIIRSAAPAAQAGELTVVVSVQHVIKTPPGMRGFAGREVTVHLLHPLTKGNYVFFADPVSIGDAIAVKERAHLDARERADAEAAVERGYAMRVGPRLHAAFLVALGTVGQVTPVFPPSERRGRIPWALARFDIERVLKEPRSLRHVTLIGPSPASKHLPRAPALRSGLHAILLLQKPPEEAMEHIPRDERKVAGFIADTLDIQPPDRTEHLARILGATGTE
jgi:hypothetical protein